MPVDGYSFKLYKDMTPEEQKKADNQPFAQFSQFTSPFQDGRVFTVADVGYNGSLKRDIPTVTLKDESGNTVELWLTTLIKTGSEFQTGKTIISDAKVNQEFINEITGKTNLTNKDAREIFAKLTKDKTLKVKRTSYQAQRYDRNTGRIFPMPASLVGFEFMD